MCRCELYKWSSRARALGQKQPGTGLFQLPRESELFLRKRDKVLKLFKTLPTRPRAQAVSSGSSQVRFHVINTVDGERGASKRCRSGMLSYPNFRVGSPDVALLAQLAEEAGVDLRILVITRPAGVCV